MKPSLKIKKSKKSLSLRKITKKKLEKLEDGVKNGGFEGNLNPMMKVAKKSFFNGEKKRKKICEERKKKTIKSLETSLKSAL